MNKVTAIILSGLLVCFAAQAAVVLEFDANDLALTNDASPISWAPSVNSNTNDKSMNIKFGAGSSVVTPASSNFTRAVDSPNAVNAMESLDYHTATFGGTVDFSFELWVKLADLTGTNILFETGGATTGTGLTITDNVLDFTVNTGGATVGAVSSTLAALPSDFIQIVGVIDVSDSLSLYVNGALVQTVTGLTITDWTGANYAQLGGTDANVAKPSGFVATAFDGQVALVRFYDTALPASEVETLYSAELAPPAVVLEFDANDLALTQDANAVSWVPSVNSSTNVESMNIKFGTGSSVVTPASSYFTRAVESPNASTASMKSLNYHSATLGGTVDFSFEIWVRLSDLTGQHILFETGGGTMGTGLTITDNVLDFRVNAGGATVGAVSNALAILPSDFIQVIGVIDVSDSLSLYVNGALAQTVTGLTIADWAGANEGQLGGEDTNVAAPSGFVPTAFDGQVALIRFYDTALTFLEIETLYSAVSPLIGSLSMETQGAGAVFSWPGQVGVSYSLQKSDDLLSGSWANVATGLVASGDAVTVTNSMDEDAAFFRAVVE
jgi:hypothetical protein